MDLKDSEHKSRCRCLSQEGESRAGHSQALTGVFGGVVSDLLPPSHNSVFPCVGKETVPAGSSFTGGLLEHLSF